MDQTFVECQIKAIISEELPHLGKIEVDDVLYFLKKKGVRQLCQMKFIKGEDLENEVPMSFIDARLLIHACVEEGLYIRHCGVQRLFISLHFPS